MRKTNSRPPGSGRRAAGSRVGGEEEDGPTYVPQGAWWSRKAWGLDLRLLGPTCRGSWPLPLRLVWCLHWLNALSVCSCLSAEKAQRHTKQERRFPSMLAVKLFFFYLFVSILFTFGNCKHMHHGLLVFVTGHHALMRGSSQQGNANARRYNAIMSVTEAYIIIVVASFMYTHKSAWRV